MENFIRCGNWKKAHTIFMTSIAHTMFLSCKFSLQCTGQIFLCISIQLHFFARKLSLVNKSSILFSLHHLFVYMLGGGALFISLLFFPLNNHAILDAMILVCNHFISWYLVQQTIRRSGRSQVPWRIINLKLLTGTLVPGYTLISTF